MNDFEPGDEPAPHNMVRLVVLAFSCFIALIAALVVWSVFQIDAHANQRAAEMAEALAGSLRSGLPDGVVEALRERGFSSAHVLSGGRSEPGAIVFPIYDGAGLRTGFVALDPPHPGRETFLETLPYKLPIILAGIAILVQLLLRLGRQAHQAAERRDHARKLALTDALSDLPNRRVFQQRLEAAINDLAQARIARAALYFIDLDGFKQINDTHGHVVGDALIQAVSERLKNFISPSDLAARLAGDEFAVIRVQAASREEALSYGRSLVTLISLPYQLEDIALTASASVGVAFSAGTAAPIYTEFCRVADRALYRAKAEGRNRAILLPVAPDATAKEAAA